MHISSLAYVGLGVSDVGKWAGFAQDILGLQNCGVDKDGVCTLRNDERLWRIALHASPADDLIYAGFEAADARAVSGLAGRLADSGVDVREMSPAQATGRNAKGGITLKDPDGLTIEVVHGISNATTPFKSPRDVEFVTGAMGLGHIVVCASDIERTLKFYHALGFEVSDYIEAAIGPGMQVRLVFLHCNERHHTLALLPVPMPKRLNHLMFETSTVDSVLTAYYRAEKEGLPIVRHMGRHTNDQMLSFYVKTPAGFDVEFGCEGVHVRSESWKVRTYDSISLWGHEP
jgi:2,3-dihydroxybiphenyl 1,2-dioxygenase